MNGIQIYRAQNDRQLRIDKHTVIYILGRAKQFTGGDELLHQLGYHLRVDLGYQVYMYYYPSSSTESPIAPEFVRYDNPYVQEIIDEPRNILIAAEGARDLNIMRMYNNIQKVIYWLSVNNFLFSYVALTPKTICGLKIFFLRAINKVIRDTFHKSVIDFREMMLKCLKNERMISKAFRDLGVYDATLHLCQSQYAIDFLRTFSLKNYVYLTDYLNDEFLQEGFDPTIKQDLVLYNPKKGALFTRKIIRAAPDIKFVPIINMTRKEVIEMLKIAKVYIDFGDHPGKDRLPREAAILGCCVVVGKRGSAASEIDMPIPAKYKFEVLSQNIPRVIEMIRHCLMDYKHIYHDFDEYREIIRREPSVFAEQLRAVFGANN